MTNRITKEQLKEITQITVSHYNANAEGFWQETKDHDVTQNYQALLSALPPRQGLSILDLGCGPGRDVLYFKSIGHNPTGLDASPTFCEMARKLTGCPILEQNFLSLDLKNGSFDGVFANATLFHVPKQEMVGVLSQLRNALVENGILFSSNPRGNGEGWQGQRYGNFMEFSEYEKFLNQAGFRVLDHYYRPAGKPRHEQPWLAVVSQANSTG